MYEHRRVDVHTSAENRLLQMVKIRFNKDIKQFVIIKRKKN